jgi:peptidyl-tRNA hydrolase, PTH1 family
MSNWLVVGLGNPGPTYATHRHNAGYLVVEELASRVGAKFSKSLALRAETAQTRVSSAGLGALGGQADQVVLLKSRTYMNESGSPVAKAMGYYKIAAANLVVVHDELDLDFGQIRLKSGGGDNGHNGLKSIRANIGTGEFFRVRFGIGRPPGRQSPAEFVLSPFPNALAADLAVEASRAADAVECLLIDGLEAAQNRFNS